ncbi:MAG: PAS domain S-box protein [Isosphaeraceae bacterium]
MFAPDSSTARRKDLHASEERFRLLSEALSGIVYDWDVTTGQVDWSEGMTKLVGYKTHETDPYMAWWHDCIHEGDRESVQQALAAAMSRTQSLFDLEYRVIRRDGSMAYVQDRSRIVYDPAGQAVRVVGCIQDVSRRRSVEEKLCQTQERFERALQNLPLTLFTHDRDLRYTWLHNPAYPAVEQSWLGRTDAELESVFAPEDAARLMEFKSRVMRTGKSERQEFALRSREEVRFYELAAEPLRDREGQVTGVACAAIDITDRRRAQAAIDELNVQLEARLRELQIILDTAPVGIIIAEDPKCKVIRSNLALAEMVGMAPGENVSKSSPDTDRLPYRVFRDGKEVAADDLPMQRAARLGISNNDELLEIVRGDGSPIKIILRAEPIKGADGAVKGAVGCCVDVTDLKKAEQALKEADRRKDQFLAMLAHELRNPLSSITNALALLRMPKIDEENRNWAGEMADRQLSTIVRLVDDLLDVSRISSGKLQLKMEPVDAATVVGRVVETLRNQLSERKHELTIEVDPGPLPLWGDPTRLEQILTNLLQNAAKYTDEGGHIILKARREGDEIVFEVSDNGIGIPDEVLPRIFELYNQVDASLGRSRGGLGIGLTLVRNLALMHGGSVMVASEGPGKGSVFAVRLPVARAALERTQDSRP